MVESTKTYQKYHSFETFYTKINANPEVERHRACKVLERESLYLREPYWQKITNKVLKDLSTPEVETTFKITQNIADETSKLSDEQLPRYFFHRYRYDIFPQEKLIDEYPPYLQIEPTSLCNYRCVFCYQTDATFTIRDSGHMGTMGFDLFKEIIDQIEGKIDFLSLASRGEPLLCKEIDRMMEYCAGKFLGLKVNTNASMLNEKHCHAILAGGVNTIVFSADAAEEPLYSQLRVKGNLDKVVSNIKLFERIKEKHYPKSKIISRVSGVSFIEKQDMESMIGLWGELVDQVTFVAYNPWENVYQSPLNTLTTPCSDLWRRMFVWFDGKVNPCDTDYKSTLAVGNIKEKSISDLWRSEAYMKLRQRHLEHLRARISPCQRCVVI